MNWKKTKIKQVVVFICALILVMSHLNMIAGAVFTEEETVTDEIEGEVVLLHDSENADKSILENMDLNILDEYGNYLLVDVIGDNTIDRLKQSEFTVDTLSDRTTISENGYQFDVLKEEPNIDPDLKIEGYESGEEGTYIIHMLGPVNPEWRQTLVEDGVEILNYIPNYAYEVSMKPEQVDEVKDNFFVDWVGLYHPAYKINPEVEPGEVNVILKPGADVNSLAKIISNYGMISSEEIDNQGYSITTEVDTHEDIESISFEEDVYYITQAEEPDLHAEMSSQQVGGGTWWMDDQYPTNTDLDPVPEEGNPNKPYREHGDYGNYLNQIGYTGEDVTLANADTGLGTGEVGDAGHPDFTDRVIGGYGFGQSDYWADGVYHGTATAGLATGDTYHGTGTTWNESGGNMDYYMGQGVAPEANIFAAKIFDDDGSFIADDYYSIVEEPAQRSDAYVHSNSWGAATGGEYTDADEIFDQAVRDADRDTPGNQPMVITASAGNAGPGARGGGYNSIGSPGNAKNIITVGGNQPYNPSDGYENPNNMYDTASRGWTDDNRIKPDVIAPSENIISQNSPEVSGEDYQTSSGTSFGNPLVSGAATVTVDWYEENYGVRPSPAMVKSILINSANDLNDEKGDTGPIPNRDEGWGIPDLSKLEYPTNEPIDFLFSDQEETLTTGEESNYTITPDAEDKPLKLTLTWTDKNAMAGDSEGGTPTLKNNLDLEVITPTGERIRGNAFDLDGDGKSDDGYTYSDAEVMETFDYDDDGWDDVNNVESVYIPREKVRKGVYQVNVKGTNIPADALNIDEAGQDFALTAYNAQDLPPKDARLELNENIYSGDDTVGISLADYDLQGEGTYDINITSIDSSGNEVDEVWVTLTENEHVSGYYEGTVETTEESPESDALYVEDDGRITAWYWDEDPGSNPEEQSTSGTNDGSQTNSPDTNDREKETLDLNELDEDGDGVVINDGYAHVSDEYSKQSEFEQPEIPSPTSRDTNEESSINDINPPEPNQDYEEHDPIKIDSDSEFEDQADEEGWPGVGTVEEPYIIEGYEINATDGTNRTNRWNYHGIFIGNTTVHFEIRNNYIYGATGPGEYDPSGIYLNNVTNGAVIDNEVVVRHGEPGDMENGIYLRYSENNVIDDNYVEAAWRGIYTLWDNSDNVIKNNRVENCTSANLAMWESYDQVFRDNIAVNGEDYNIMNYYSAGNSILNNTLLEGDSRGILLGETTGTIIKGNTITGAGSDGLYFFLEPTDVVIEDNYISDTDGPGIRGSDPGLNITRNTITNNEVGIDLYIDGNDHTITYNTISNNEDQGLYLDGVSNNLIYGNRFIENGINAEDSGSNTYDNGDPAEGGDGGNYWSDYTGEDRGDGVGDEPYIIGSNQDNYPWFYDVPGRYEHDMAVLNSYPNSQELAPNETFEIEAFVANLGRTDETDVEVNYTIWRQDQTSQEEWTGTTTIDIEAETFEWIQIEEWTPPEEADDYYINVTVSMDGDQDLDNNYIEEPFEVRDNHDVGISEIKNPGEKQPNAETRNQTWEWRYDNPHRAQSDSSTTSTSGGTYYAGMKINVSDRKDEYWTDFAFFNYEDSFGTLGYNVSGKIATVDYKEGQPVVDEFVGTTEENITRTEDGGPYTFGWKEMDLEEPVKITEDEYWVLAKVEDWGENNFWIGKGDHNDGSSSWWTYSNEDPTDPDAWQQLDDDPLFGGSWMVEGQISDYYYGPQYEDSVFNETQPVEGMVENYGNKDETNVTVNATITSEETGDQVYTDETLVNINKGEQELAKFQDWIPPEIGYYTINMTTNLTTDENQTNDYLEKTIYVAEIDLDLKADSIDSPNEPLYQYENKTIKGSIKNVGNYRTNTSVEMKIQRVNESDMITENFTNGLPSDWSVEDLDGTGDTWSDEYGEYMKVVPENDTQNDILWTNEIDASHVTHRMPLRFYSEYEGNSSRQLVISTDGGDTVQTVKSDIGEGYIEYDLSKWTSEESSVMIGWEFFSETAEEGEYWLIDDVDVNGESLHEPAYVNENTSDQVYPRMTTQVQFDDWKPDPQNLSSDYVFTMKTLHPDDNDPTNNVTTKRMFIEYNLPPNKPKNPQPANESTGISHLPEFSVNVTDPNVYVQELDVTFHLLNETGVELQNMTVTNVLPGNRASVVFSDYLEAGKTYNWYVEVEDFKESNISETWTFETYEVQPMWKTASAEIDADPPEPVENLTVEWNAGIWDADANLITWDSSYDDGSGENDTDYYNLYRSDSTEGPWDESTRIARINADKSDEYTYLDEGKAYDDTQWHYVVRGVDKLDNVDLNEQYASEKPVPTATNPNPEDGAEVEGLQQTISTDVTTPTGEPLTVKFYYGENRQLISEHTGITNETVETDYGNLTEEQMGKDHYWFVTVSYEDYNVGDIVPDNVKRGPTDEQWVYKYDAEHRASAEDGLGLNSEDVWWGAMTIDLSERAGGLITQVAYYDYEDGASYAQAHVAKDDGGAPGEWLASSDEYTPSGAGWTELELDSNVVIEEDTEYWIVIELEDYGTGNYPFGTISPAVEDAGLINYNDLRNPSDWDSMDNLGFDYSWCLEALVAPKPEPEGYSFYLQDTVGPVADAGDNFTDYQGETVTLDGSASSDNVEVVNWTWNIENPKSEQTVKYGEKVGYTLEYAGDYEVELTVSDEAGHSATDTITITSLDTEKPTAKPGAPGQTRAGETYNLDGSASTDNVGIVNYTWDIKGVSGMAEQESYMDTVNGEDIDYEFPYTGAYDITLTVTDAEGNYDTEKTSVVVDPSASTFEITSPSDGASIEKKQVEVQWTDHSDMKDITYETRLDYGGWQDVGTDTSHTFIGLQDGEHIAQIRATDSIGNTYTKSVTFNIDVTKPDFQITNPSNGIEQLTYDEELVIKGTTDPDVQVWINGNEVQVTSEGTFEYEATLEKGQNVFRVTSEDDQGDTRTKNIYALYLPDLDSYVTEDDLTSTLSGYLNETEINDVLTDYVTEGELSDSLRDYMTEDEINDLLTSYLDDYVTKDNLTETLDPYLTESQINDMISDFITNGDLNDALNDYLTESEINTVLDDYITQADLTETLNPYLTESEINDLMTDYVTNGDLTDTLKDYLTEDEFNEVESEIKGTQSDISSNQDDQDDDISMNMILGIVGIILAIIALILGAWSVMNKGGKTETQEQPSQYTEESQEEELEDEDFFSEEELEE